MDPKEQLVRTYFEVLASGEVAKLSGVLADDYQDADALSGQLSGAAGATMKLLLFRAQFPDAVVHIDSVEVRGDEVHAAWQTTSRGLGSSGAPTTWRYRGVFTVDTRIRGSRIEQAEPLTAS